jgi:aryl-alcohol dehydrogenase-like predicted oxidoreductase
MPDPVVPTRTFGRTGEEISCLGLGGSHIGDPDVSEKLAIRLIQKAIDHGLTFLDNSWDYHDGRSEKLMGKALQGGYREKAFVMTKFDGRSKKSAAKQIDESLQRLKIDHLDLLQFHEVIRFEDVDAFFAEGGAAEALTDAQKAGKTRYVGFTGHKDPHIHLYMLGIAKTRGYQFDSVQMPVNILDSHFRSFTNLVLPVARQMDIAVLGMKSLGGGAILESGVVSAEDCLRFALSQPVAAVITGIDSEEILEQALRVGALPRLTEKQITDLRDRTAAVASRGEYELFKTSNKFDATAKNLEWLGEEFAAES